MNRDPRVCPETAQQAAGEIMDFDEGTDLDGFLASDLLQRAVERQLTTLGAGLEESSPELAERIPGMAESVRRGNLLVHEYDRTNSTEIWQVALRTLPEQRRVVLSVLSELNREEAASELRGHGP